MLKIFFLETLTRLVPGDVGRRLTAAIGISGAMLSFKGGPRAEKSANGNGNSHIHPVSATNGKKSK